VAIPSSNVSPITLGASQIGVGVTTANLLPNEDQNFVFVVTFVALTALAPLPGEVLLYYVAGGEMPAIIVGLYAPAASPSSVNTNSILIEQACKPGDQLYVTNASAAADATYSVSGYYWSPA
jgi:hypothetical protein